jgi:crotonobetainyl-CoA:carnitine CoA-transferase CaiB-like acyl-CoA transferase
MNKPGADPALKGLRVLDLTTYVPGPFCTQMMADLGAAVIKIERPGDGDREREGMPSYFQALNRGKLSMGLDLRSEEGRDEFLELAATADVVIEGFRPGVVERLGIGYAKVRSLNPKVIYASISGYGQSGPLSLERGHDLDFMAWAGALDLAPRLPDGTPASGSPFVVGDCAAGMYALIAILAALAKPDLRPAHIDVSIAGATLAWAFPKLLRALWDMQAGAEQPVPAGERPGIGVFATGDGRHVSVSAVCTAELQLLCTILKRPDLAARMEDASAPPAAAEVNDAIRATALTMRQAEFGALLQDTGIATSPVRLVEEVFDDPDLGGRTLVHVAPLPHLVSPISGIPSRRWCYAPALDEHGERIRAGGWRWAVAQIDQDSAEA